MFNETSLKNFTDLDYTEKEMILAWRNDIHIRKWMYTSDIISLEDHLDFICKLKFNESNKYFLVSSKNEKIGVVYLTDINYEEKHAEFGIYSNPNLQKRGNILMEALCQLSFDNLRLKTIHAEVFSNNHKAVKLYHKFGFLEKKEKIYKDKKVIIMELNNENR